MTMNTPTGEPSQDPIGQGMLAPPQSSDQEYALKVIGEHHQYLRLVAGVHMAWLTFHVGMNAIFIGQLCEKFGTIRPIFFPCALGLILWNIFGFVGSMGVADYYKQAKKRINDAEKSIFKTAPSASASGSDLPQMSEAVPNFWISVAWIISAVCLSLIIIWILLLYNFPLQQSVTVSRLTKN